MPSLQQINAFYATDRELARGVPAYPQLPKEIVVVAQGDQSVVVSGPMGEKMLTGSAALAVLPKILPLLDGTNGMTQIVERCISVDEALIRGAIHFFHFHGLLEEGATSDLADDLTDFLGASRLIQPAFNSRTAAAQQVRSTRIAIISNDTPLSRAVLSDLQELGIVRTTWVNGHDELTEHYDFALYLSDGAKEHIPPVMGILRRGIQCFYCSYRPGALQIGPVFSNASSDCIERLKVTDSTHSAIDHDLAELAASLITLNIINYLSGLSVQNFRAGCVSYRFCGEGIQSRAHWTPIYGNVDTDDQHSQIASRFQGSMMEFQASLEVPQVDRLHNNFYRTHYSPENIAATLTTSQPRHTSKRVRLAAAAETREPCDLAGKLNVILKLAVGIDSASGKRISPSGGNLKSCEFYLLDSSGLFGPAAVYRYYSVEHVLEQLDDVDVKRLQLATSVCGEPHSILISVSCHKKVFGKYGPRAYRIINFDAGVSAQYARACAASLQLDFVINPMANHELIADLLNLQSKNHDYVVTGVYSLREKRNVGGEMDSFAQTYTNLLSGRGSQIQPKPNTDGLMADTQDTRDFLSLRRVMMQRRSVRYFARKPISIDSLQALSRVAATVLSRLRTESGEDCPISLVALVQDSTGSLDSGLYRLDGGFCERVPSQQKSLSARSFIIQSFPAEAPVVLTITIDCASITDARQYRWVHFCIGSLLAVLWLEAVSAGLCAVPMGAIATCGFADETRLDVARQYPLMALCIGYEERIERA